ncbi:MAG: folate family ECF transporter S component, partial [Oscillospiraceae bacterium]|nr:folate family ECF transporter S component [Oscillospiraceae bacterium]
MRLFGNVRVLIIAALLIAMSIVFGKVLSFTIGPLRISFENLPILMAGIFFGSIIGMVVGAAADVIGCLIVGYAINPIITAGAAWIG